MFTATQIVGVAAVILPMLTLCLGLVIASRRRSAEYAEVVPTPAPSYKKGLTP